MEYFLLRGVDPIDQLTHDAVVQFAVEDLRRRRGRGTARKAAIACARSAVRALSCALAAIGIAVPPWRVRGTQSPVPLLVREFVGFRLRHRGIAPGSRGNDERYASSFLAFMGRRGRRIRATRISDIDAFVQECAALWRLKTVAGACSVLRAFLRFLHATRRIDVDLAAHVVAPRIRSVDRPPRALPWNDVRRILRAIDVQQPLGRRDFAMFLMMATYGMGAGEIVSLRLEDIDWRARVVHVRRPKTGAVITLPLLDPVGRALAVYLRKERPRHARDRTVFVSHRLPHARFESCGALRHRLAKHAEIAEVHASFLGTHVFRYSHATRQIEMGAPAKVVGDILGHRRPASTSVYVRGAIAGLRNTALPVPR